MYKVYYWVIFPLFCVTLKAQEEKKSSFSGNNEIRFDVLSVFTTTKLQLTYERFFGKQFSTGVSFATLESEKNKKDFEKGFNRTKPDIEITPFLRYAFTKNETRFYFIEIFTSYNTGQYRELQRVVNNQNTAIYQSIIKDYSDIAIGGCIGYKMYFKEKISLDFHVGMGKNLFNQDKSPEIIPRVGANIGYRF